MAKANPYGQERRGNDMDEESPSAPSDIDPLQGHEDEVVETYLKGAEEVLEEIDLPQSDVLLPTDGFFEYRDSVMASMGDEWKNDPQWWREQVMRDWETIQERVRMQMDSSEGRQMGNTNEGESIGFSGFSRLGALRVVDYEQFILEANAGQFREERFYCDKGRRWIKKVREVMITYGYPHVRKVDIDGYQYLEVSKQPMGDLDGN